LSVIHKRFISSLGPAIKMLQKHNITNRLLDKSYLIYKHLFDDSFSNFLTKLIEKGSTVIDVGANIGFYTNKFSKLVGKNGLVLAVEPHTNHLEKVKKLELSNTIVIPTAAGNRIGHTPFFINETHPGDHRCFPFSTNFKNFSACEVEIQTLSDIINKYASGRKISLIKIDVQGYDFEVLKGLENWLQETVQLPTLIVEIMPKELTEAGASIEAIQQWFDSYQYKLFIPHRYKLIPIDNILQYLDTTGFDAYFDLLAIGHDFGV